MYQRTVSPTSRRGTYITSEIIKTITSSPANKSRSIIKTFHYSNIETQLHSVPPWAVAWAFSMILAYASDKTRHRYLFTLIPIAMSITGFAILLTCYGRTHLEYGALFLITSGTYGAMPVIVCWFQMNLGGHHRRAVGTGWQGNSISLSLTHAFSANIRNSWLRQYRRHNRSLCLPLQGRTIL